MSKNVMPSRASRLRYRSHPVESGPFEIVVVMELGRDTTLPSWRAGRSAAPRFSIPDFSCCKGRGMGRASVMNIPDFCSGREWRNFWENGTQGYRLSWTERRWKDCEVQRPSMTGDQTNTSEPNQSIQLIGIMPGRAAMR